MSTPIPLGTEVEVTNQGFPQFHALVLGVNLSEHRPPLVRLQVTNSLGNGVWPVGMLLSLPMDDPFQYRPIPRPAASMRQEGPPPANLRQYLVSACRFHEIWAYNEDAAKAWTKNEWPDAQVYGADEVKP